jgi:hypothetical protein
LVPLVLLLGMTMMMRKPAMTMRRLRMMISSPDACSSLGFSLFGDLTTKREKIVIFIVFSF